MQIKKLITSFLISSFISVQILQNLSFATGEVLDSVAQDASFKTAVNDVAGLRLSVEDFKQKLLLLDQKSRDNNKGKIDEQYRAAREEMVRVIQTLDVSTAKIGRLLKQLYSFKMRLKDELQVLKETQGHLQVGKQYLNQLLLLVYKMQREIYTFDGEKVDDLKVFMKGKDTSHLLVGNDTLQALLAQINDLLKQASAQEADKNKIIRKLVSLKAESQKALAHYQAEIEILQQKKAYLATFMQLYRDKKIAQISQDGVAAEMKLMDEEIAKLVKLLVAKKGKKSEEVFVQLENLKSQVQSGAAETSPLAWPTYPVSQILRIFKDPDFEKEYGFKNLGVQLAVDQSSPVYAMRDGVVYHVQDQGLGVHWLMIVHTDGYVSIYQYLNEIAVKAGDVVRRGQFVGKSG